MMGRVHLSGSEKKSKMAFFSQSRISNPGSQDPTQRNKPVELADIVG
jgi:hypothetical protein